MNKAQSNPENASVTRPIRLSEPVPIKAVKKGNVIATVGIGKPVRNITTKGKKKTKGDSSNPKMVVVDGVEVKLKELIKELQI